MNMRLTSLSDGINSAKQQVWPTILRNPWLQRFTVWGSLIMIWYFAALWKGPFFLPTPTATAAGLGLFFAEGFGGELLGSLRQFILGFLIAIAVGVPLGLLMGSVRVADNFLSPYMTTLFVAPKEALLPFLIILFGFGFGYRASVVFVFCVFLIVMQVAAGVRSVDAGYLEAARSFGHSRFATFRKIVLFASAPYVISGIRLGLGLAIKGMVIAEIWIYSGVGGLARNFVTFRRLDLFFALVLLITGSGVLAIAGLGALERRIRGSDADTLVTVTSGGYWLSERGFSRVAKSGTRAAAAAAFVLSWEIFGRVADLFAIPPFTETMTALWQLASSGEIWTATGATLRVALIGFVLSGLVGILIGSVAGLTSVGRSTVQPLIDVGLTTPMTLVIPALTIYVGIGFTGKITLVVLITTFLIAVNTAAGVANVSPDLREIAAVFGVEGKAVYTKIIFPQALPSILTGLRLGAGAALSGALIGDLLLRVDGVGVLLIAAGHRLQIPRLLAIITFLVIIGALGMGAVGTIDRRLQRWLYV